jgi:hypothetical protein
MKHILLRKFSCKEIVKSKFPIWYILKASMSKNYSFSNRLFTSLLSLFEKHFTIEKFLGFLDR